MEIASSPATRPLALAVVAAVLAASACGASPPRRQAAAEAPAASPATAAVPADILVSWNERVLGVAEAEDGFLTLKGLRTAAMLHLAVHDALNAIEPRYASYLPVEEASRGGLAERADSLAAAVEAAYRVAVAQYPDRREIFDEELRRALGAAPPGRAREEGRRIGAAAADRVLAARRGDGWDGEGEYEWATAGPGVYAAFPEHSGTPEGFVFGAGWGRARPFVLESPDQFLAPPPPSVTSDEYARAYAEVKDVGRFDSPTRTAEQTRTALWWKEFVESSHNRLARELVAEERLDLWDAARMFALLETAVFDAYVGVFHDKFHYNHWRPFSAIRGAADDGNPLTEPDPEWDNTHRHTYPFPSYPSAHGTACAAAAVVLASVFGEDRPVTMTVPEVDSAGPFSERVIMDPATRTFPSFADAARECALSRVYLGIHFRYDSLAGNELGTRIGRHVVASALAPR